MREDEQARLACFLACLAPGAVEPVGFGMDLPRRGRAAVGAEGNAFDVDTLLHFEGDRFEAIWVGEDDFLAGECIVVMPAGNEVFGGLEAAEIGVTLFV